MAKHDRAKHDKQLRNLLYANRFRQRVCKNCGHRSSRTARCVLCGGEMKGRKGNSGPSQN